MRIVETRDIFIVNNYKKQCSIAVITLNGAEVYNAIDPETERELSQPLIDFRDGYSSWVGIIKGAINKAFCSDVDIKKYFHVLKSAGGLSCR